MGMARSQLAGFAFVLMGLGTFGALMPELYDRPRSAASPEMQVAMPRFVQVILAAGDRYLAANFAGFRALVVSTEKMDAEGFRILGLVQSDVAWLNPAHEDNYYLAAAILPWAGEVGATQYILRRASEARPFDWQPPFYLGFNELHFLNNPAEGARWLRLAATHTRDEMEQIQLLQIAANWVSKGEDTGFAIRLHRAMAKETRHKAFAVFLEKRAKRLENLMIIDEAINQFRSRQGRDPRNLQELLATAILASLPEDPFGAGYSIGPDGRAVLLQSQPLVEGRQ